MEKVEKEDIYLRDVEMYVIFNEKSISKIWGFHGGDYDDYHLPEDDNHQKSISPRICI
jgi:hypothetical protein